MAFDDFFDNIRNRYGGNPYADNTSVVGFTIGGSLYIVSGTIAFGMALV